MLAIRKEGTHHCGTESSGLARCTHGHEIKDHRRRVCATAQIVGCRVIQVDRPTRVPFHCILAVCRMDVANDPRAWLLVQRLYNLKELGIAYVMSAGQVACAERGTMRHDDVNI